MGTTSGLPPPPTAPRTPLRLTRSPASRKASQTRLSTEASRLTAPPATLSRLLKSLRRRMVPPLWLLASQLSPRPPPSPSEDCAHTNDAARRQTREIHKVSVSRRRAQT